jgi:hypothetical protein
VSGNNSYQDDQFEIMREFHELVPFDLEEDDIVCGCRDGKFSL